MRKERKTCLDSFQSGWICGVSVCLLSAILFIPCNTFATEPVVPIAEPATAEPTTESTDDDLSEPGFFEKADGPRNYISEKIVSYSKSIDQFFGDERYFQEHNKSVVQVELGETFVQGGHHILGFKGKAKIDLPSAQRRFRFILESNPEQTTAGEVKKDQVNAPKQTVPVGNYAASLRYEKKEEDTWHFSSDLGANFQFPIDPFIRTRGSYSVPLGEWRMKLAETVFWFSTIGLGETTQLDFEHVLTAPDLLRTTGTATCLESPKKCDLRLDLTVFHTLSERAAVIYQASVVGVSEPELAETDYILMMRYRYKLHKDWVFLEISPQFNFPRTDKFKLNAQLLVRLEMLFGATE